MPTQAAINRGTFFEIDIGPILHPKDNITKVNAITNLKAILEVTKGRNLILSNSSRDWLDLRGPYDLINFLSLFGIHGDQAKKMLSNNIYSLLSKARSRQLNQSIIEITSEQPNNQQSKIESNNQSNPKRKNNNQKQTNKKKHKK